MKQRIIFFASLIIIILIGWADVLFFGNGEQVYFSDLVRQILHVLSLSFTCATGFLYFKKYSESWTLPVWISFYSLIAVLIIFAGILEKSGLIGSKNAMISITIFFRNLGVGPLPFLALSILQSIAKR